MKTPLPFVAALAFALVFAVPALAWANPFAALESAFQGGLDFFLKVVIRGLAICAIAWCGVSIASGRKTVWDCVGVLAGAALALLAPTIVSAFLQP